MAYTRFVIPLDITVVFAYLGNVSIGGGDYDYNGAYAASITNQAMYDAPDWYRDARPKPTWSEILANWSAAKAYFNVVASPQQNIENNEQYLEGELATNISSLKSRMTAAEGSIAGYVNVSVTNALATRMSTAEGKIVSLESWRAAKAPAKANVPTNYSVPTAVITLGLNAPTAAGINSVVNTIMGEINGIYQVLRDREIMAA